MTARSPAEHATVSSSATVATPCTETRSRQRQHHACGRPGRWRWRIAHVIELLRQLLQLHRSRPQSLRAMPPNVRHHFVIDVRSQTSAARLPRARRFHADDPARAVSELQAAYANLCLRVWGCGKPRVKTATALYAERPPNGNPWPQIHPSPVTRHLSPVTRHPSRT